MSSSELKKGVTVRSASALVVASMIGAGIFTTTGFQAAALGHPGFIFALWIVGGVLALCGALCFTELGSMYPQAGAEYVYIRETYGQVFGFMSAFVGLIAGFSAPIAAALKSLMRYLGHFFPVFADDPALVGSIHLNDVIAILLCWSLVLVHTRGIRIGLGFNDLITFAKVFGIILIIGAAFIFGNGDVANFTHVAPVYDTLSFNDKLTAFATSLIFVSFCYLGWNASAYMAAEMNNPQRDLPRSLLGGTVVVIVLYALLNAVYFYGANVDTLAGEAEVGLISARNLFDSTGASLVTLVLSASILASASAMTVVGPRVYYAFGMDFPPLAGLAQSDPKSGAPKNALILQGIVTTVIILSGRIDQIIQFSGFTLTLFASLAVSCVVLLRVRHPELERPFKTWGYPITPILFLGVSLWTMIWAIQGRPWESIAGLLTAVLGGVLFYVLGRWTGD
jgi:basic amino acid/polyamine antiporter, APA family